MWNYIRFKWLQMRLRPYQSEDEAILRLAEQGGDTSLEYLAYEDYLEVRT